MGTSSNYSQDLPTLSVDASQQVLAASGLLQAATIRGRSSRTLLQTDSRQVGPGDLFIAYKGVHSDGHTHLASAIRRGAATLVVENAEAVPANYNGNLLVVSSARAAWAWLAAAAYGNPQNKLKCIGITGTNGKSTTAWYIHHLLDSLGVSSLLIGTLGARLGGEMLETKHTSPDPDRLYALLAAAVSQGAEVAIMESSSHGLDFRKFDPIAFSGSAWTSFSRDHLDYHGSMEAYWKAKAYLFSLMKQGSYAAIRQGVEPFPSQLLGQSKAHPVLIREGHEEGRSGMDDLTFAFVNPSIRGSELTMQYGLHTWRGKVPLFAPYDGANFATAMLLTHAVSGQVPPAEHWLTLPAVPGRMQLVGTGRNGTAVFVDYAHTPDALEKSLLTLRGVHRGAITVVFGCGGDRDRGKRPEMGAIASRYADDTVITSDNPRSEDPESIISEIAQGTEPQAKVQKISDRKSAIQHSITTAPSNSIVLIAGKGHETYQIIGDQILDFDDAQIARSVLTSL